MKENVKISIITPCYNSEKTIRKTIESVLNQTYQNYEYIIIDGKSTDKTLKIIDEYRDKFGDKLTVISEPDKGIYDAMNKGIKRATGHLVGIVNSDDYYELEALNNIVNSYNGEQYLIIYGFIRTILDGKEKMVYLKNYEFLEQNMITHPSCFITKKLYDDFGLYSLKYKYSSDYEFMLRIKKNKEVIFKEIYEIISNFSIDGASSSAKAYMDTINLKHEYGLLNGYKYYFLKIKTFIAIKFKR